jgi:hypothetical protein
MFNKDNFLNSFYALTIYYVDTLEQYKTYYNKYYSQNYKPNIEIEICNKTKYSELEFYENLLRNSLLNLEGSAFENISISKKGFWLTSDMTKLIDNKFPLFKNDFDMIFKLKDLPTLDNQNYKLSELKDELTSFTVLMYSEYKTIQKILNDPNSIVSIYNFSNLTRFLIEIIRELHKYTEILEVICFSSNSFVINNYLGNLNDAEEKKLKIKEFIQKIEQIKNFNIIERSNIPNINMNAFEFCIYSIVYFTQKYFKEMRKVLTQNEEKLAKELQEKYQLTVASRSSINESLNIFKDNDFHDCIYFGPEYEIVNLD